jgi:hypothetical protein
MTSKIDKSASNKLKSSAPDGKFGWFIVIAYGTANVSEFNTLKIYREQQIRIVLSRL